MSMSPPPLPPNPYAGYPHAAPEPQRTHLAAAVSVWISASLLLVFSACCAGVFVMLGVLPLDQFQTSPGAEDVPAEAWEQIATVQPFGVAIAVVIALVTTVPALAMLVLGFGVRSGKRGVTITTLVLASLALLVMGLMLLLVVVGMATGGGVDLCSLSLFGGMTGCLVWCVLSLKKALTEAGPAYAADYPASAPGYGGNAGQPRHSSGDDPWENSL